MSQGRAYDPDKGRLIVDSDMAWDLLDMFALSRIHYLTARHDLEGEGGLQPAVEFYDGKLKRLHYLRKRVKSLILEKEWGDPPEDT